MNYKQLIEALTRNAAVKMTTSDDLLSSYMKLLKHCEPSYVFTLSGDEVRIYYHGFGLQYIKSGEEEVDDLKLASILGYRSVAAEMTAAEKAIIVVMCKKIREDDE
jgi:hypothetical protein